MRFIRYSFVADIELYLPIEEEILEKLVDWPERKKYFVKLCLEEAVANAVKHGNKGQGDVNLFYKLTEEELIVFVIDKGEGFNLRDVPDPTIEEGVWRESGRGIALMRYCSDFLKYLGKGNSVIMKFNKNK